MRRHKLSIVAIAAAIATTICAGAFIACGDLPVSPEHIPAVSADCTAEGNIEYWTLGGKYYSDSDCTTEISLDETVIAALGHDFSGNKYQKDALGNHWRVCTRTATCGGTETATGHEFTDGTCVCGAKEVAEYTVTISDYEFGEISTDKTSAAAESTVTLTVTPDDGYEIDTLKYGETNIDKTTKSFTMPEANVTITATFKKIAYTVTVSANENGTVTASGQNVQWGATVTVMVNPATGYELNTLKYSYDTTETDIAATKSFTMPKSNVTVTATFTEKVEKVDAKEPTCTEDGNIAYWKKGANYYTDAACSVATTLASVKRNALGHTYTYENLLYENNGDDHSVKCERYNVCSNINTTAQAHDFSSSNTCVCGAVAYNVSIASGIENGTVAFETGKSIAGKTVTLTVTPAEGYKIDTLKYGETNIDKTTKSFTMPETNVTITATFVKDVTHFAAVEATCQAPGKDEYWVWKGSNYSDAACETAFSGNPEKAALGHKYSYDTLQYVIADDTHSVKCERYSACNTADTATAHTFGASDTCVCSAASSFKGGSFNKMSEAPAEWTLSAQTYTANSVALTSTKTAGTDWHLKYTKAIDNVKFGHYYEITYTLSSTVGGEVWFESPKGAYYNRVANLIVGENTIKFRFAVGEIFNNATVGGSNTVLLLGKLESFTITITNIEVTPLVFTPSDYSVTTPDNKVTINDRADGDSELNVRTTSADGVDYHLKVEKDLSLQQGKTYEIVFVFTRDTSVGNKKGNIKFEVYDNVVTFVSIDSKTDLFWIDDNNDKVFVAKFRFTANQTVDKGSCLSIGEMANETMQTSLMFTYIELKEVPA